MNKRTKKSPTSDEALARARRFCSLNERTKAEVSRKLIEYGVPYGDVPAILEKLTNEGFLNEKRFASAFAGGKFRLKKWGRNRIRQEMKKRGLPKDLISEGLSQLQQKDYSETLDNLLKKKLQSLHHKTDDRKKIFSSLVRFALQKGYETDLVMERIRKLGAEEEE